MGLNQGNLTDDWDQTSLASSRSPRRVDPQWLNNINRHYLGSPPSPELPIHSSTHNGTSNHTVENETSPSNQSRWSDRTVTSNQAVSPTKANQHTAKRLVFFSTFTR